MNRCFTNVISLLVRLTLFLHNCIVTWIIFIAATRKVHTCRTAPLHAILNFLISLFAPYNSQSHKILQFCCFQVLPSQKVREGGEHAPLVPPGLPPVSATFRKDIHVTFYLLTWTYFNDVSGSRNILTNSQLKRILFMSSKKTKNKKNETKLRRRKKSWKKITAMKVRLQWKWDTRFKFFEAFLNLNQKQTSGLLAVLAVMMRKKVLNIK